jgi:hypothetical protein
MRHLARPRFALLLVVLFSIANATATATDPFQATLLWRCKSPLGSAEIAAHDPATGRVFSVGTRGIAAIELASGQIVGTIHPPQGTSPTSVACHDGKLAVVWCASVATDPGQLALYEAATLKPLASVATGIHPDMVVISPDGRLALVACEGEPALDYVSDPPGSVTLVGLDPLPAPPTVVQLGFEHFNAQRDELRRAGVRLTGPSHDHPDGQATVAEDLEPEYIAISEDSTRAWVTLQENNAVATIDLTIPRIVHIAPLGAKSFYRPPSEVVAGRGRPAYEYTGIDLDPTDHELHVRRWPVVGLFQPDAVATFRHEGVDYLLTANEGDGREWGNYSDATCLADLRKTGVPFDSHCPGTALASDSSLGQLSLDRFSGDTDGDGDLDQLCCFGARSFSVWRGNSAGDLELVFDSGSDFEERLAQEAALNPNLSSEVRDEFDTRSGVRGPEPEGLAWGFVGGRRLVFIGLERAGGVMVYDLTDPLQPTFVSYLPGLSADHLTDRAPEGIDLVPANESPTGRPLLIVSYEMSATLTAYELH